MIFGGPDRLTRFEVFQSRAGKISGIRHSRVAGRKVWRQFAFVDYFHNPKIYGTPAEFENYLRGLKLSDFELKPLQEMMELPLLLRHPKILGQVGIVYGRK